MGSQRSSLCSGDTTDADIAEEVSYKTVMMRSIQENLGSLASSKKSGQRHDVGDANALCNRANALETSDEAIPVVEEDASKGRPVSPVGKDVNVNSDKVA